MARSGAGSNGAATRRCAIYTRKSSEEGLEQDFNSLDAQREACEAYIRSQKSAGWTLLSDLYDDGGLSGATMERPALQRLLADIQAGRVETVVVYKVDRLTRSLSDFAKIVEAFDAKGVTFVSVTQAFNTTTSMGRLMLNMLLSFAQFEREVTGERIRDKIAASKQKGMWMGGLPPLGYDVRDRRLVVNQGEADTVRRIFRRYAALNSVRALKEELDQEGVVSKVRRDRFGRASGGTPLARGALYRMLQNRIYRGEISHKDKAYPGLHEGIIDQVLWEGVQAALDENRVERVTQSSAAAPSLLAGLVYDDAGERMSPTHANKKGARYRYYVSHSLIKRGRPKASATACRVPAADLETIVEGQVCALLRSEAAVFDAAAAGPKSLQMRKSLIERAANLAREWPRLGPTERRAILQILLVRIDLRPETVDITFRLTMLTDIVNSELDCKRLAASVSSSAPTQLLSVPSTVKRVGKEMKLLIQPEAGAARRQPDRSLMRLLGQARRFNDLVMSGKGATITELATMVGVSPSYFTRVFRLSFLAPEITRTILQGRQPLELTANTLIRGGKLPSAWSVQRPRLIPQLAD
ncbi:MAG TPA: recombinase family protein [Alphaproteobacteria bacterium]|nr:recombinase family protein [Alphaproteobacteria bacterium]